MTHIRIRLSALTRALLAFGLLAGLIVVTPVALSRIVGWPLPSSMPTWDSFGRPIPDEALIKGLAVFWWAAWAQLVVCLTAEVVAYAQGRRAARLPGSATMQRLAGWLVTSLVVVGSSPVLRVAALPQPAMPIAHRVAMVAPAGNGAGIMQQPTTFSTPERPSCTVARRDTLWGIAARHLGDPQRWPEIFELNRGRPQPGGGVLDDPRSLKSGWSLIMPTDAVGLDVRGTVPSEVVVAPGDTLSEIAEDHLGSDDRWAEVFELNRNRAQNAGGTLTDPDLIRPGWRLRLPGAIEEPATPIPAPSAPASLPAQPLQSTTTESAPAPAATFPSLADGPARSSVPKTTPSDTPVPDEDDGAPAVPIGVLGAGLAAGGVVLALDRLRRARQRHRVPGQGPARPDAETAGAEQSLRLAAEEQHADVDRLDVALRALGTGLAERGGPVPTILALQLGGEGLELLLSNPSADPPPGFAAGDEGWAWTITSDEIDRLRPASGAVAPLPALVTVGSGDGGTVLVDLETAGSLELMGDQSEARRLLAGFALELATSTWADHVDVVLVGPELPELAALHRARRVATIDEVIEGLEESAATVARELTENGLGSTFAARSRPGATESWSPTIVLCADPPANAKLADRVAALVRNGGEGIAVVVAGRVPGARWSFACDTESISMSPLNLRVRSAAPPDEDVAAVAEILDDRGAAATEPVDLDEPEEEPAEPAEPPAEVDVRTPEAEGAPPLAAQPFQPGTYEVEVRILGPVEIVGSEQPVEAGKPAEILVYLATHPGGVDSDRLKTSLWPRHKLPASKTFSNAVSAARQLIGAHHLPHAANERYRLAATVTTDQARFEAMARYARLQTADEAITTMRAALELVRGVPFSVVHGFHWAPSEGMVDHAQAVIVDVAHRMAQLCLDTGDPAGAEWAAHQGLLASPGNEALFRDRMQAADAAGNPAGVEAAMDELCEFIEGGNPYDTLHPETIATYEKLSKRRRHEAAAG